MFVYYYSYVSLPFDRVAAAVSQLPDRLLSSSLGWACREAAALNPGTADRPVEVTVNLTVGNASRSPGCLIMPLRAEFSGPEAPMSSLEADLEVGELGEDRTQITLRGSYRSVRRASGQSKSALGHRIAEAATRGFVERLVGQLALDVSPAKIPGRTARPGGTSSRIRAAMMFGAPVPGIER